MQSEVVCQLSGPLEADVRRAWAVGEGADVGLVVSRARERVGKWEGRAWDYLRDMGKRARGGGGDGDGGGGDEQRRVLPVVVGGFGVVVSLLLLARGLREVAVGWRGTDTAGVGRW